MYTGARPSVVRKILYVYIYALCLAFAHTDHLACIHIGHRTNIERERHTWCVCETGITGNLLVLSRGPGQIHRRLVNEAGDVSEDMEMGRHFHVPALLSRTTEGNGSRALVPFLLLTLF